MAASNILLPLTLICTISATARAATTLTSPTTTTTNDPHQAMNSSSCLPLILKMTICLDFLVTGSIAPTPSDKCCLRLKLIGEIDFPCLCDIFSKREGWGRKLNRTRAESLPLSCGLRRDDHSLKTCRSKSTIGVAQPAQTPKSPVFDLPSLAETHHADHKHAEVPQPSAPMLKSPAKRLLTDTVVPKIAFPVIIVLLSHLA